MTTPPGTTRRVALAGAAQRLDDAASDAAVPGPNGGYPAGWLYTDGNKIMVSTGSTGTQWMGRGVNMDDIFMCGYDNTLYLAARRRSKRPCSTVSSAAGSRTSSASRSR